VHIVDEEGRQRVLCGVNRSGLEYDKAGNGISEEEIAFICQEWKAEIIRLPFNQEWMSHDKAYANFVDEVIRWVWRNGAYAVLDLQWENTTVKIPPIPNEDAIGLWRSIAERYKDEPAVLYDIHNEAHDTSWPAWRARAIQIIEAIRAVHPRALIFVSGLDWAFDLRGWVKNLCPFPTSSTQLTCTLDAPKASGTTISAALRSAYQFLWVSSAVRKRTSCGEAACSTISPARDWDGWAGPGRIGPT
jgi:hypothetical protein